MDVVELWAMTPHPQANPPPPAGAAPVGLAMTMTPFAVIDGFMNGQLTHEEFIHRRPTGRSRRNSDLSRTWSWRTYRKKNMTLI